MKYIIIAFCIFLLACSKDEVDHIQTDTGWKSALLSAVNSARESGCYCGDRYMPPVGKVKWNDLLEEAARIHSKDMHDNGFFSHTGSDGSRPGDRIRRVGYNWFACSENIMRSSCNNMTPQQIIDMWLGSEGHCRNIMNPIYKDMGLAKVGSYYTQTFGAR